MASLWLSASSERFIPSMSKSTRLRLSRADLGCRPRWPGCPCGTRSAACSAGRAPGSWPRSPDWRPGSLRRPSCWTAGGRGWWMMKRAGLHTNYCLSLCHTHTQISTCASGGPASSRISNKWLCPSTSTSFLYLPPDKDNDNDRQVTQQPVAAWQVEDEATSHSRQQEIRSDASAVWKNETQQPSLNDLLFKKPKRYIWPALTQPGEKTLF